MGNHKPQISRVFLVMIYITLVFGQLCKNCQRGCDQETGECSGSCSLGWDGPICSRQNVALERPTTQPSTWNNYTSKLAVDGGTEQELFGTPPVRTCTHTQQNGQSASWAVTLDKQYSIFSFRIYNRKEDCAGGPCGNYLNGFTLSVGNSSRNYRLCYQDITTAHYGPGDIIDGSCYTNSPILGDTVKIMINNSWPLTLCEVQIFVCTPGTYGPDCGERCGRCAEGPSVCDATSGLCPQRTPRCMPGYRPENCDEVCTLGNYGPDCAMKCGHCADDQLSCDSVSGTCAETKPRCMSGYSGPKCDTACKGNYGPDCLQRCGSCAEGRSICDAKSGNCPEGTPKCMSGYTGVKCDTECRLGTYGPDCKETCGFCAEGNAVCNTTSGHCPDREPRCAEGYYELWCKSELPVSPANYTGVIAGSAVGIILVLVIGVIVIVILLRRFQRNLQTGGATQSEANSAAAQERSAPSEVEEGNEISEPERMYDAWNQNSVEEHPYEAICQNSR